MQDALVWVLVGVRKGVAPTRLHAQELRRRDWGIYGSHVIAQAPDTDIIVQNKWPEEIAR